MKKSASIAAALAILWAAGLAFAQGTAPFASFQQDPNQPVDIASETLSFDRNAGTVVFEGDVEVVQGSMTITADQVEVFYADDGQEASNGVTRMIATGSVLVQTLEETVEGDAATYDLVDGVLAVDGNVRLTQGHNVLSAGAALINIEGGTGEFVGRVRSTFVPQSNTE
jgi:lipopolysaccharide export system protein LptA